MGDPTSLSVPPFAMDNPVWKFFLGACTLTAAMLQPHAPLTPLFTGMALAGVLLLAWSRLDRQRQRPRGVRDSDHNHEERKTDT